MTESGIPEFQLSGSYEDIGAQHGHYLASRIEDTLEFYGSLFGLRQQTLFDVAKCYKKEIKRFSDDFALEIEALSDAAGVDPLWIYALNARSEIINNQVLECTAIFFPKTGVLGQNWDWSQVMEQLVCVLDIKAPGKPLIKMVTEPGIIGKIGMNSEGLGVCLNILACAKLTPGVPVHILLRALLESQDMHSALAIADSSHVGKASNVLLADSNGQSYNLEFAGEGLVRLEGQGVQCHTNHYLGWDNLQRDANFEGSTDRLSRAYELAAQYQEEGVSGMKAVLKDNTQKDFSICSGYHNNTLLGRYGTVLTLVMDLGQQKIWLKRGSDSQDGYQKMAL